MKRHAALAGLAFLPGSAGSSPAAQTSVSPCLPTGTSTSGARYLPDVGSRSMSVTVSALNNFPSGLIDPDFQNCNDGPSFSGHTCVLLANDLPDDVTFECSALVTTGDPKRVLGLTSMAHAVSTIASTAIHASQRTAQCIVGNVGPKSVV